jgi:hypothetical protein
MNDVGGDEGIVAVEQRDQGQRREDDPVGPSQGRAVEFIPNAQRLHARFLRLLVELIFFWSGAGGSTQASGSDLEGLMGCGMEKLLDGDAPG